MTLFVVGIGQAGGAILNEMVDPTQFKAFVPELQPLAINSTARDMERLGNLKRSEWAGLSPKHGIVAGATEGFENMLSAGFGKDPQQAANVMKPHVNKIAAFIANYLGGTLVEGGKDGDKGDEDDGESPLRQAHIRDAILIVGLGGGTGAGTAHLIAKAIKRASNTPTRIIVVGILPATYTEESQSTATNVQAANALFAIENLEKEVDGFILLDNERLAFTQDVDGHFPDYNRYAARALNDLLSAHRLEGLDVRSEEANPKTPDLADIVTALRLGQSRTPGFAAIGWAAEPTKGYFGHLFPFLSPHRVDAAGLLELAMRKLSINGLELDTTKAERTFSVLRVPQPMAKRAGGMPRTFEMQERLSLVSNTQPFNCTTTGKRYLATLTVLFTFPRRDLRQLVELERLAHGHGTNEGLLV